MNPFICTKALFRTERLCNKQFTDGNLRHTALKSTVWLKFGLILHDLFFVMSNNASNHTQLVTASVNFIHGCEYNIDLEANICTEEVRFLASTCSSWDFRKTGLKGRFIQGADDFCFLGGWLNKRKRHNSSGMSPNSREGSAYQESDQHEDCHNRVKNRVTPMNARNGTEANWQQMAQHTYP